MSSTAPAEVAGWDRVSAGVLVRTARAIASESLRVPIREVRARVSDDGSGRLAIEITSPLAIPVLGSGVVPDQPVVATAHAARGVIAERVHTITGRQVSRVTVVYDSSVIEKTHRVR